MRDKKRLQSEDAFMIILLKFKMILPGFIKLLTPLLKYVLVEVVGFEPTSKDIATQASTCVVDLFKFR